MPHTICTFNVNNLFLRYRFGQVFPGDMTGKSRVEQASQTSFGYLPLNQPGSFEIFNPEMRALAATTLRRGGTKLPDVICFQEVESMLALRALNEQHFGRGYRQALVIDSGDFRQIDVGILTNLDILAVRSHVDDPDPKGTKKDWRLFSRDCLEVTLGLNKSGSQQLTLFINHLKSRLADDPADRKKSDARRNRQATGVARIVKARFPGAAFGTELFAVVGDLNDSPDSAPVKPLVKDAGLVDAFARIAKPEERWTHYWRGGGSVSQLDHLLLSPALDAATAGTLPVIERRGVGFSNVLVDGGPGPRKIDFERVESDTAAVKVDFRFPRFPIVTPQLSASDHCPIFFEVP